MFQKEHILLGKSNLYISLFFFTMQSQKGKHMFIDIMLEEANNNFKNKDKYNILNVIKVRERCYVY